MAYCLNVDIVDEDDSIHLTHHFWGQSEQEVRGYYKAHQEDCDYLSDAVLDGRVIEELKAVPDDALPQVEEESEADGEEEDQDEDGEDVDS